VVLNHFQRVLDLCAAGTIFKPTTNRGEVKRPGEVVSGSGVWGMFSSGVQRQNMAEGWGSKAP